MLHRFLLTALLVGGLFGCLPVSQIPQRGTGTGPDPVEAPGLDVPDITGTWLVESADRSIRQIWTLQMIGNAVTGEFVNAPDMQAPGVNEQPRPVQGRVIGSGDIWGVRLETPSGTIGIQNRTTISYCPVAGDPNACRTGKRFVGTPPPASSPGASASPGSPSARPSWVIIHQ